MDVIDFLAIIGYTVTIFSIGYTFGKDFCQKTEINRHSLTNLAVYFL